MSDFLTRSYKKTAAFTDLHLGRKSNCSVHNTDCFDFVTWFCENVKSDKTIDSVMFLGDWHENRSALNISTLDFSYQCASLLNDLGLPVFFCVGNHDLYRRNTRDIHSVVPFNEFDNFVVVDRPIILPNAGNGALVSPFLFHEEYPNLTHHLDMQSWWGHFEFKGFVITGYNVTMPTGPNPDDFSGPTVFSGHFHKRQSQKNIHYIGNAFPMDFSDADDVKRGMVVYSHETDSFDYTDWDDCPRYNKIKLSELLAGDVNIHEKARVRCLVDVPLSYEESIALRQGIIESYSPREFALEESHELAEALAETEAEIEIDIKGDELMSVDELVILMIEGIDTPSINPATLSSIYRQLNVVEK